MGEEDLAPASAADTLRLIEEQRSVAERSLTPDPRLIYWPWGLAWLVGFGLFFLRFGPNDRVFVNMPAWLPLSTLYVLMIAAHAARSPARSARHQVCATSGQKCRYVDM